MSGALGEADLLALECAVLGALASWPLSPSTRVELLNVSENATFLLHDPDEDRRLVLRVQRPGYRTEPEIRSELAWIFALREQGVVGTPAPVAATDGNFIYRLHVGAAAQGPSPLPWSAWRPKPARGGGVSRTRPLPLREGVGGGVDRVLAAVAFEYVSGREPAATGDLTHCFQAVGAITARLHQHARAWCRPRGFVRNAWDFRATLGERALWGDWRAGIGLEKAGIAVLQRVADCLRIRLARFGRSPDRFGLIHADLRLSNLIVAGGALNVIDFDDCGFGWLGYDFAASVSFFEHEPRVPELLAAWLDGYRTVAPFSRENEAEIPTFIMLRRMLLLAWIASHRDAPVAREIGSSYTGGTLALADDFLRR